MANKKRVLIIGLDGFTWDIGRDFMAEGVMPNLAELVKNGCHGALMSVMPFETSPAWSSFQTGCSPGKTGVFSFHRYDRSQNKIRLNSFADIAVPSLWELADRAGKTVVSLNMPVSSPPPKVKGIIIPGLLCPKLSAETVHPPQAYDKYIRPHKNYLIVNKERRDTAGELVRQAIDIERVRCQVALELMKDVDWDIFSLQMQSGDALQHELWDVMNSSARQRCPDERAEVLEFYRHYDDIVGTVVQAAGDDVLTLIVSDHGFGDSNGVIGVNTWLSQKGYLQFKTPRSKTKWYKVKKAIPPLKGLAVFYGYCKRNLAILSKYIKQNLLNERKLLYFETVLDHLRRQVDLTKTKALCLGGIGGMLYILGTDQERKDLAKKITAELLQEFGPSSQVPVIKKITPGAEVYGADCNADLMPDIVLEYEEGVLAQIGPGKQLIFKDIYPGTHYKEGVFVINGTAVKKGQEFGADIIDIAPTVLAYLGIPVPRHMDGKVLTGAFNELPITKYEDVTFDKSMSVEYTDAEQAKVEKNLADLGYL